MSNDDAGKHPLLPCPFCGATDSLRVVGAHKGEGWGFVRCDICDAEGPDPDSGVFWNDRAPSAEMFERAADAKQRGKEGAMYRCPTCSGGGEIAPNAECPDCDGTGACIPPAV